MRPINATAILIASLLIPTIACADVERACCVTPKSWYFGITGEGVALQDNEFTHPDVSFGSDKQSYKIGYGVTGSVGKRILPDVRTELEVAYRASKIDSDPGATATGTVGGIAQQSSINLMANGYYDFNNSSHYTPYIGAGIGGMRIATNREYAINGDPTGKVSGYALSYQFMAGITYAIRNSFSPIDISLGYRYVASVDASSTLSGFPGTIRYSNDSHNVELGLRLYFK